MSKNMTLVLGAALLGACGGKHPGSYETLVSQNANSTTAESVTAAADALFEERADQAKLEEAIAKYKEAVNADPLNRYAHELPRAGHTADAFTDDKEQKIALFLTRLNGVSVARPSIKISRLGLTAERKKRCGNRYRYG